MSRSVEILKNYLFHDSINTSPVNTIASKKIVQSMSKRNKENLLEELTFDNLQNYLLNTNNNKTENKSYTDGQGLKVPFQQIEEEDEESSEGSSRSINSSNKQSCNFTLNHSTVHKSRKSSVSKGYSKKDNIWNRLYKLDKELKEKRDLTHLEKKLKEEEESLKECTFKPELLHRNCLNYEVMYKKQGNIYERAVKWKKNIQEKYLVFKS
jgi:hypothetical protein